MYSNSSVQCSCSMSHYSTSTPLSCLPTLYLPQRRSPTIYPTYQCEWAGPVSMEMEPSLSMSSLQVGMPSNSVQVLGLPKKHTGWWFTHHETPSPTLPPLLGHTIAHSFLQQVLCRAQATLPPSSSSSASHRCEVLGTCISDLLGVGGLDGQLSDRALCAAAFLQCQLLSEEVGLFVM